MSLELKRAYAARIIAPSPLFVGVACSFIACCLTGFLSRDNNCYQDFSRFHRFLNPESHFYPTACQVRSLARSSLSRDKITVVVSGNSIMFGLGQRPEQAWTKKLEAQLGSDYQVINLGMMGAFPGEFGGVASDLLSQDYSKLILIVNQGPANPAADPDGKLYRYFFWDAYYKGLLPAGPDLASRVNDLTRERDHDHSFLELRMQMALNGGLSFGDFWTTLAYSSLSTVWNPVVAASFTKPRQDYADPELGPRAYAWRPRTDDSDLTTVRSWIYQARISYLVPAQHEISNADGTRHEENISDLEYSYRRAFPKARRKRTLVLAIRENPFYVKQLSRAEQTFYGDLFSETVRILQQAGFRAMDVGADYDTADFFDRCHISEQGAEKLARDVAPKVRELAARLGYLDVKSP